MDFLLQALCNTVEAKRTSTFDEHYFVVQVTEHIATEEFLGGGKEILFINREHGTLGSDIGTDAYQLVDVAFLTEGAHLAIEFRRGHTALEDVTENQRKIAGVINTTTHKVEGYAQRVDIGVVGVVDKRTTSLSFLYFQTHGNRF